MSRNNEMHFSGVPSVDIQRSKFERNSRLLTTFNTGKLIPIYVDECLPGDTVTIDTASLVRMTTPIFPVMDNAYLDIYYFFVPNRLLWDHWKEFNGENNTSYWAQPTEYNVPMVSAPVNGWTKGSVADYMGIPTDVDGFSVSALPLRAYSLIWNEFFRDQNYMPPAFFTKGDADALGVNGDSFDVFDGVTNAVYGGSPLPVSKFHDYFTSVLPAPQKGEALQLPFFVSEKTPVGAFGSNPHGYGDAQLLFDTDPGITIPQNASVQLDNGGMTTAVAGSGVTSVKITPANLYADLTSIDVGTINELRQAFQIQRLLERDARGGTRYTEILNAHFGVTSPDARLQRPEYLGGKRIPINVDQVIQTSATNSVSPQGNTSAFSLTTDIANSFTKSFTEHGYLIGLCCVRTDHTYQQGLDKMWSRSRRFDFYWPALAHISEQPVLRKEILVDDISDLNEEVFGYQEAWAEYRYKPSRVCGAFRSNYKYTLDAWHYADQFEAINESFIADGVFMAETYVNVDRTLAVQSDLEDQFLGNFYFKSTWVRPMPLYSVPGLIDHF